MSGTLRVRRAEGSDIPALKRIWSVCFGDEAVYIDFFFEHRFSACRAVCAEIDHRIVGAAYLFPARMRDGTELRPAWYGYAVGVDPQYRRRGICESMLRFVYAFVEKENAIFFLSPASPELAAYYERIGMNPTHYAKKMEYKATSTHISCKNKLVQGEVYHWHVCQKQYEPIPGAVVWPVDALRYAAAENKTTDGICRTSPERRAFAAGRREADALHLTTLCCPPEEQEAFLVALAAESGVCRIVWRQWIAAREPDGFVIGMTYNMRYPASGPLGPLLD